MLSDDVILAELEPTAAELLDRHLAASKEWFPHALVPWSRGEDFEPEYEWSPEEVDLPEEVRSALFVNLLTEDNLPYYFRTIERMFGADSAWGVWARRWTAEEGRHSIVIRDYLTVTRSIDPVALERARMAQVECGEVPEPETALDGFAYVALQELATRIAHHNTGKVLADGDRAGYEVMKKVASDENRHHLFYRDLVTKALELEPSGTVQAIERQVRTFEMPGTGIVDFEAHAKAIAKAGIYNLRIHEEKVVEPLLEHWRIGSLTGLTPHAREVQEKIMALPHLLARRAQRFEARLA